jgi:diguanylate cyclase (GGDEF)-like protein
VAARLKATLRDYDLLGRYGGEEFIVSANEQLAGSEARLLRLKQAISNEEFNYKHRSINLTISIGACFIDFSHFQAPLSPETLIELADKALYEAKAQGRNRVVLKHHDGTRFEHKTLY